MRPTDSDLVRPAGEADDLDLLRDEIERLKAENDLLREHHRVPSEVPDDAEEPTPPVRVLLMPNPAQSAKPGHLTPEAVTNVARIAINHMRKSQPTFDWRAEHDLALVPGGAECFHLGEVMSRIFKASGPAPKHYRVEVGESGDRSVRRCIVAGEAESDHFSAGYSRLLRQVDDLFAEGTAAHEAGAAHHAGWTLKAADVVLAQATLALASFQLGRDEWKTQLERARPEYDPRYDVSVEQPIGL
jgi:hypothetical protein